MAVLRQFNWLGQLRADVPHLRMVESAVAADFDVLAGRLLGGGLPYVARGFTIVGGTGQAATTLRMATASGVLVHPTASEAGTVLSVPADRAEEVLSATNARVVGAFTPGATNFVGLDLRRAPDDATTDLAYFRDATTLVEAPKSVPLARVLDYRIVISTVDFSALPHVAPVARVVTDAANNVTAIQDARQLLFRLGGGGSTPNAQRTYAWPSGRTDGTTFTTLGDKAIGSLKEWMDAVMTRLWELGGGERWFAPSTDRNIKLVKAGTKFTNGEYFEWDGTHVHWRGLSLVFDNSTALYNDIADQLTDSPGLTNLADGECLYVDVDRTANRTGGTALVAAKAPLATLGNGAVPGARWAIVWRKGSNVFIRDEALAVGQIALSVATTASNGIVRLSGTPGSLTDPQVAALNASNIAIAAGVTRAGGVAGAGALSIGTNAADQSTTYGHAAHTGHLFQAAAGNGGASEALEVRNETEYDTNTATILTRMAQKKTGVTTDVFKFLGQGGIGMRHVFGTPPVPAANEATLYFDTNGVASPNKRVRLMVVTENANRVVIWESDSF